MAKESRGTSALRKGAEGWSKSSSASAQGAEAATWSRPLETPPRVGTSRPEPFPGAGPAPLRPPSDYRRAWPPAGTFVPVSVAGRSRLRPPLPQPSCCIEREALFHLSPALRTYVDPRYINYSRTRLGRMVPKITWLRILIRLLTEIICRG